MNDNCDDEHPEFCGSKTYKNILLPKEPYEDGTENYYKKYQQLNESDVVDYEKLHGLKLPEDLRHLLLHQNGGHIEYLAVKQECLIEGIYGLTTDISGDRWLFSMIPLYDWLTARGDYEVDEELAEYKEDHKRLIVIDGDGHHFISLDYRNSNECEGIVSVELECGYETEKIEDAFKDLFNYW